MYTFLLVCHTLIAIVLVIVVLVQSGKGGGLGAGFGGGGANTLFGSSGGSNFFTKLTMGLATGFMITSLGLTIVKSRALKTSIFDQSSQSQQQAPVEPAKGSESSTPAPSTAPAAPVAESKAGAAPSATPTKK